MPVVGERLTTEWLRIATTRPEDLALAVAPYLRNVARWTIGQAGGLALLVVQLLLTVVISAILYSQGETVAGAVLAFARRLAGDNGERVAILSAQAIRAVALGIVVTALVQAIIAGIGLAVAGVPHAAVLTAVMFLLGVAQIGTVPVLACGVVWLYWTDQTAWATVLVVWALITASLDNFLRPMLIRRGADLPLLLIFAGVVGGLLAFGSSACSSAGRARRDLHPVPGLVEDDPTRRPPPWRPRAGGVGSDGSPAPAGGPRPDLFVAGQPILDRAKRTYAGSSRCSTRCWAGRCRRS